MISLPIKSFLPFKINISKITNNIYLGSIDDAYNYIKLKKLNISHILNTAKEIPNFYPKLFRYKKLNAIDKPCFDYTYLLNDVADFINIIVKNNNIVWVHCYCGISRSTTAIIAYLIKYKKFNYENAIKCIRSKRNIVNPNKGFKKNLLNFYNKINNIKPKDFLLNNIKKPILYKKIVNRRKTSSKNNKNLFLKSNNNKLIINNINRNKIIFHNNFGLIIKNYRN